MEQVPKRKKTRSKSFDLGKPPQDSAKHNKSFDIHKHNTTFDANKETDSKPSAKKKSGKEKLNTSMSDVSQIANDSITNFQTQKLPIEVTSTPFSKKNKVKPIIKNTPQNKETDVAVKTQKPGKRNKSVSFMIDDEEVATKKTKSQTVSDTVMKNKTKKNKNKYKEAEKENKLEKPNQEAQTKDNIKKSRKNKEKKNLNVKDVPTDQENQSGEKDQRSLKKSLNSGTPDVSESGDNPSKPKKPKLKKKKNNNSDNSLEPQLKSQQKEIKPELIAENLENLNIGENPHKLSNLLDEMTVATKKNKNLSKKRRNKIKSAKENPKNAENNPENQVFKKKKSAKDRRRIMFTYDLKMAVMVDNIPVELLLTYKKLLNEYLKIFGPLKHIGVAEMHSESPKMKFSTIVYFHTEEAAEKAVAAGVAGPAGAGGARLRLRAPPPRELATLVLRSHAALDEQRLSGALLPAGRLRAIHAVDKGKKAANTAFVEFDSAEALERALALTEGLRLGGKRVHAARFDPTRRPKRREPRAAPAAPAAAPADTGDTPAAADSGEESD